jgi:hypothetical protein
VQALQIREFLASITPALSLHFIKISLQIPNCREGIAGCRDCRKWKNFSSGLRSENALTCAFKTGSVPYIKRAAMGSANGGQ